MNGKEITFIVVSLLIIFIGALSIYQMHTQPILPIEPYETALGIPWRLLVAQYVFFAVSATGLCIVVSLGELFGVKKLEKIAKEGLVMALVMILIGLMTIGLEIEQVMRGSYAMLGHTNPSSLMFWMIMFYVLYLIFLSFETWFLLYDDLLIQANEGGLRSFVAKLLTLIKIENSKEYAKVLGMIKLVTAVIATSTLGALFSVTHLKLWHDPLLPIYFILTAIVSGAALIVIGVYLTDYFKGLNERHEVFQTLRHVLVVSIIVTILFTAWKLIIKAYPNSTLLSRMAVYNLMSDYAINFWVFEFLIGLILPLMLLILPKTGQKIEGIFVSSLLVITGMVFCRIDHVVVGQLTMKISGIDVTFVSFHPLEILSSIGFVALFVFGYYLAHKLLPLGVEV
ncbi:hypothetical protein DRP07_03085 [Archaeoglobales archaeon]|nr:MAG: hypothetical protein DRP07_03085 [Archaeoglobales archaeon]